MKKARKKDFLLLVALLLSIPIIFFSPRIFFRSILLGAGVLGDLVAVVHIVLTAALIVFIQIKNKVRWPWFSWVLLALFAFSFLRYLAAGPDLTFLLQWALPYSFVVLLSPLATSILFYRYLLYAIFVANLINFVAIFEPTGTLQFRIAQNSMFGWHRYREIMGIGIIRHTGFMGAPGALSLFGTVSFFLGISRFLEEKKFRWLILAGVAFACGAATFNRTFVLGVGAGFIICCFWYLLLQRRVLVFSVSMVIAVLGAFITWNYTIYGERMQERLSEEALADAVEGRFEKVSSVERVIGSIIESPFLGSAYSPLGVQGVIARYGNEPVRPHNGLFNVYATRGIIYGTGFTALVFWTVICLYRTGRRGRTEYASYNRTFFIAYGVGLAISLVESFWEQPFMLLCMVIAFGSTKAAAFLTNQPDRRRMIVEEGNFPVRVRGPARLRA